VTYDHIDTGEVILQYGVTKDNLKYVVCKSGWWEYVVEIGKSCVVLDISLNVLSCLCHSVHM
jgi:hypothetical protein